MLGHPSSILLAFWGQPATNHVSARNEYFYLLKNINLDYINPRKPRAYW
jgi:hypothetical protein